MKTRETIDMRMRKALALAAVAMLIPLTSPLATACAGHMYLDPNKLGFFGGAVARVAGLTPPPPVFELEHPIVVKATVGKESEVTVDYSRPFLSKNVRMTVTGTGNVEILGAEKSEIQLEDRDGTITLPFKLTGSGYDSITLTVRGEHRGKSVLQRAQIYVRANPQTTDKTLQVSGR